MCRKVFAVQIYSKNSGIFQSMPFFPKMEGVKLYEIQFIYLFFLETYWLIDRVWRILLVSDS